jgi:DNA recombination protein RmuC
MSFLIAAIVVLGLAALGVLVLTAQRRHADVLAARLERVAAEHQRAASDQQREAMADTVEQLMAVNRHAMAGERDLAASELDQRQAAVQHLVEPIAESLRAMSERLGQLEISRQSAYAGLTEQVRSLQDTQELLRNEAANLVTALRAPAARGRWGEIQLRRVVEMAGMMAHCDFTEQTTVTTDDRRIRPDLVVRLPGKKTVVVDAKVALEAYLQAIEATDDTTARAALQRHARQVRTHVDQLATKAYWSQFASAPDFVVLFVPGDQLLSCALEHDPALMEHAVANNVLLATPVTLIALLRAVAYGWQQEKLAENASQIAALGRELHDRIGTFANHFAKVGRGLDRAVTCFNEAAGSLESRVLVQARRFQDLSVTDTEIPEPVAIEKRTRSLVGITSDEDDGDTGQPPLALEA